jgi:hypothetical protein
MVADQRLAHGQGLRHGLHRLVRLALIDLNQPDGILAVRQIGPKLGLRHRLGRLSRFRWAVTA